MNKYIVLYGEKKIEDNVLVTNMFENTKKIALGWTEFDYNSNLNTINEEIKKGIEQIIFFGLEIGWDKLIETIKSENANIKIKVICNTLDSLLYYDYERDNFFRLLEMSKNSIIDDIAFLRKGQYETYSAIGYKCSYLMENYTMNKRIKLDSQKRDKINVGIYPLNYVWDKNIFNQLSIAKFIENCNLNFNDLDPRMEEFLKKMKIEYVKDKVEEINEENLIKCIQKNDVIIASTFTDYFHTVFFISMEMGIPCLIGNNSDFFDNDDELKKYIVTSAEDNPITNSEMVKNILENKEKIQKLYGEWKEKYNQKANKSKEDFFNKE